MITSIEGEGSELLRNKLDFPSSPLPPRALPESYSTLLGVTPYAVEEIEKVHRAVDSDLLTRNSFPSIP